ncbi:Transmembrane protein [Quillaja saponaria]|nr:Transmembrane protein [Quillaja saponaria]
MPATKFARSFWLGTNQLHCNLSMITAEAATVRGQVWRVKLEMLKKLIGNIVALRSNLQMYLNEGLLCWYQRLQTSKVPHLELGRRSFCIITTCVLYLCSFWLHQSCICETGCFLYGLVGSLCLGCTNFNDPCTSFVVEFCMFLDGFDFFIN